VGRKQTIDRGALLDAAERVVFRDGAGQLTIEAVAGEAGVSKGGVLYAFTNKDGLIDAMFNRVFAEIDEIASARMAEMEDTSENRIRAHTLASRDAGQSLNERSVALVANFMRSPQYRKGALEYYDQLMGKLDLSTASGRKARLALFASEGALLLRGMDFFPISETDWVEIHNDILAMLLTEKP
jgi:AcrR family transcriptional regulator